MNFVDRVVQHPNRIRLIPTGNANEYEVERAEGNIITEGTPLIADNINTFAEEVEVFSGTDIALGKPSGKAKIRVNRGLTVTSNDNTTLVNMTGGEGMWVQDAVQNRGIWLFQNFMQMKDGSYLFFIDANQYKVVGANNKERFLVSNAGAFVNSHPIFRIKNTTSLGSKGYGGSFDNEYPAVPDDFVGRITFFVVAGQSEATFYYGRGPQIKIPAGHSLMAIACYSADDVAAVAFLSMSGGGARYSHQVAHILGQLQEQAEVSYLSSNSNSGRRVA